MGKSLPSTTKLQEFTRIISSDKVPGSKRSKHISEIWVSSLRTRKLNKVRIDSERVKLKMESAEQQSRVSLRQVISDCVKRWFQDTLKEAKAGDSAMQVLVGQMYFSGYGVARDPQKGRAWVERASRSRSTAWSVSDKHPGYNASDSDSNELKEDAK